jgi:hypothetical protein
MNNMKTNTGCFEKACNEASKPAKPGIDLDKPLQLQAWVDRTVRLLTKHLCLDDKQGALVAVTCLNEDIEELYVVNAVTGIGIEMRTNYHGQFRNVPTVTEEVLYLNYYGNGKDGNVLECFDTRMEAEENNLFYSRDCCVKLFVKSVDGVWSADATIVSQ